MRLIYVLYVSNVLWGLVIWRTVSSTSVLLYSRVLARLLLYFHAGGNTSRRMGVWKHSGAKGTEVMASFGGPVRLVSQLNQKFRLINSKSPAQQVSL